MSTARDLINIGDFLRAHEGAHEFLCWWQTYDEGEFDDKGPSIPDLLLSARDRAKAGLGRMREMEGSFSNLMQRGEFEKAALLLDGMQAQQENFDGEASIFPPLVVVHERLSHSGGWSNYRMELEKLIRNLEDLLGSSVIRTSASSRLRFPDPHGHTSSDSHRESNNYNDAWRRQDLEQARATTTASSGGVGHGSLTGNNPVLTLLIAVAAICVILFIVVIGFNAFSERQAEQLKAKEDKCGKTPNPGPECQRIIKEGLDREIKDAQSGPR